MTLASLRIGALVKYFVEGPTITFEDDRGERLTLEWKQMQTDEYSVQIQTLDDDVLDLQAVFRAGTYQGLLQLVGLGKANGALTHAPHHCQ